MEFQKAHLRFPQKERHMILIKPLHGILSQILEAGTSVQDAVRLGKRDPSKRRLLKVSVPSLSVKKIYPT